MTRDELRNELDVITSIFFSIKYLSTDFKYFSEQEVIRKYPTVYKDFHFLLNRIWFSMTVNLVLNLSKLYDESEKYSIKKLLNKMQNGYKNSELNPYLTEKELIGINDLIENERIEFLKSKIKIIRDKFYAHLDRTHQNYITFNLNYTEITELVENIENILKTFELKYFNETFDYELTAPELGYNVLERLVERDKYWNKYGRIEND
ncbi:MAG: hypothetical protein Q7U47_03385 [Paludibacter sp.]|nr:hypothetical protein [Paludibacter sp.]